MGTYPSPLDSAGIDDPEFRDYVTARGRALLRTAYLLTGNLADAEDRLLAQVALKILSGVGGV